MIVSELIAELQKHDGNRIVVMASDGEGNTYSPLCSLGTCAYQAETTWSGEVGLEALTPEDESAGYDEDDVLDDGVAALCLTPVN